MPAFSGFGNAREINFSGIPEKAGVFYKTPFCIVWIKADFYRIMPTIFLF
jgi:hypothetical protein